VTARIENAQWLAVIFRWVLVPLFLFSGTFFPIDRLPDWLEPVAWATPLWHGVALCRDLASGEVDLLDAVHVLYLVALTTVGTIFAVRACEEKLLR
jgi:lipooligosaccharide transport system permease protein